jgi:type IV secretory pathway VirD2 relaxase
MPKASLSEMLRTSPLMRPNERDHALLAVRDMQVFREDDRVRGTVQKGRGSSSVRSGNLGAKLSKLISERTGSGRRARLKGGKTAFSADARQRVIATVFYQGHGGGGAGRLAAHGKYLERDGAGPDGEKGQFYDREHDEVDAHPRLEEWASADKRHFRLMLAPESGARIEDLKDFTRATMARMERDLGFELDWLAVDHHNTDNPHVHIILRGRRRDGPELIIPREYVGRGLRHAARDVATEMLGNRGPEDERLALERETRSARQTRLDQLLEVEIRTNADIRIQAVGRKLEPVLRAALRNRVRELVHMGLAHERKRGRFRFEPEWTARLQEIGRGLDIRRRLGRELAPGEGKLRLYRPSMGRFAGEVIEIGRRGDGPGKAYAIVRSPAHGPVFVNVRARAVAGIEPGGLVAIEPHRHEGRGNRVKIQTLSALPLETQVAVRAETELDRELARGIAGEAGKLPSTPAVQDALAQRIAWHEREKSGGRDLTGRFEFEPGALKRLREAELAQETRAFSKRLGKRAIAIDDGMEREWTVRGFKMLHQGRVAMLERNDGVALAPLAAGQQLAIGKSYSISIASGKTKAAPSLGLER